MDSIQSTRNLNEDFSSRRNEFDFYNDKDSNFTTKNQ